MLSRRGRAIRVGLLVAAMPIACAPSGEFDQMPEVDLTTAAVLRCGLEPAGSRLSGASIASLAGEYRLFMTGDDAPGDIVSAGLILRPVGDTTGGMGATPLLIGHSDVDPAELGAVIPGNAAGEDPEAPGVGVYAFAEDPASPEALSVVLRLGAESNRRDRQRFDGAHTTLQLSALADQGFGGTWSSAEGASDATGAFCAVRS